VGGSGSLFFGAIIIQNDFSVAIRRICVSGDFDLLENAKDFPFIEFFLEFSPVFVAKLSLFLELCHCNQ
jgi:hypothetical protein